MPHSSITAQKLARNVCNDIGLPMNVRREARLLLRLVGQQPDRVIDQLNLLRVQVTPELTTELATIPYARCVSIELFYKYHLKPGIYDIFKIPSDYRDFISSINNPAAQLFGDLREGTLIPAEHSWLVPYSYIQSLTAIQIMTQLKFNQAPPYVVMVFTVDSLLRAGIKIREPRGTDTIPSVLTEWFPNNVKGERINSDIPRAALEDIEWRI